MENKIRILLLMPELFHGGAEKQFRHIISRINTKEFEVFVVIEHSYKSKNSQLEGEFISMCQNIYFKELPLLNIRGSTLKRYISAIILNVEVAPLLISYKPDILITYELLGLKVTALASLMGVKCIYCERNSGEYPKRFYRNHRVFLKGIESLIANSKTGKKNWEKQGIRADYIPNGIEVVERLPVNWQQEFTIVVPARIAPVKNQEILIKAIAKINERLNVILIGKTEDYEYKMMLEKLVADMNLENKISFLEYTDNIASLYAQASLVVLPSISEGFANVVLESYMFGRLCVLSDISMNRDVGAPGQRYFKLDDEDELTTHILTIMHMQVKQIEEEIDRNYKYVVSHYSMENMTRQYEEKLRKLSKM